MKRWYSFYNERIINRQRAIDEKGQRLVERIEGAGKGQQVVDQL